MIFVLGGRFKSLLFNGIKKVLVAVHLTSHNDVRVTKNLILHILDENMQNLKYSPKMLGISNFDGFFWLID